jgi:hypothetical protein
MGRRLIALLLKKDYAVKAVVREGSEKKTARGLQLCYWRPV